MIQIIRQPNFCFVVIFANVIKLVVSHMFNVLVNNIDIMLGSYINKHAMEILGFIACKSPRRLILIAMLFGICIYFKKLNDSSGANPSLKDNFSLRCG